MLRQSRTRPLTPSRYTDNNNHVTEATKSEERRASRSSLIRKQNHWSQDLKEVTLVARKDGVFNFRIVGGSDHGDFPVISEVMPADTRGVEYIGQAELITQDVLLEIQGQKVAGYTRSDMTAWLNHCSRNSNPVVLKTAPQGVFCEVSLQRLISPTAF